MGSPTLPIEDSTPAWASLPALRIAGVLPTPVRRTTLTPTINGGYFTALRTSIRILEGAHVAV